MTNKQYFLESIDLALQCMEPLTEAAGYDVRSMKSNLLRVIKKLGVRAEIDFNNEWGYMTFTVTTPSGVTVGLTLYKNKDAPSEEDIEKKLRSNKDFSKILKKIDIYKKDLEKDRVKEKKEQEKEKELDKKNKEKQKKTDKETLKKHGKLEFSSELRSALYAEISDLASDIHTIDDIKESEIPGALAEMAIDAGRIAFRSPELGKELDAAFDKYGYDIVYAKVLKMAKDSY